jgi:hypothetical protein
MGNQEKPREERHLGAKRRHGARWNILRLIQPGFIGDFAANGTPLQAIDAQGQALPADGGA